MLSRWVIGVGSAFLVGFLAAGCGRSSGRDDEGAAGGEPAVSAPENAADTQLGTPLPTGDPSGTGSEPGGTGTGGDEGGTGTDDEGGGTGTGDEGGTPSACTEEGTWVATHDGDDDDDGDDHCDEDDGDDGEDDCASDAHHATSCGEISSAEEIDSVLVRLPCFHMLERVTVTDLEGCRPISAGRFGSLGTCSPDSWGVTFAGLATHRIKVCVETRWPINPDALSIHIRAGDSCRTELEATASCYLGSGGVDD